MLTPDLFAKLGLFVRQGFLDAPECARICGEMIATPSKPAGVFKNGERVVESTVRRTLNVSVSASTRGSIESALDSLAPALSTHFGGPLARTEGIHFLRYRPGDFFTPHRDSTEDPAAPLDTQARRVSMVLFLNDSAKEPLSGQFSGGVLRLYGLMKQPHFTALGLPLEARTGMLVAFPSEVLHAVEEVTTGERFSVVSWLRRA